MFDTYYFLLNVIKWHPSSLEKGITSHLTQWCVRSGREKSLYTRWKLSVGENKKNVLVVKSILWLTPSYLVSMQIYTCTLPIHIYLLSSWYSNRITESRIFSPLVCLHDVFTPLRDHYYSWLVLDYALLYIDINMLDLDQESYLCFCLHSFDVMLRVLQYARLCVIKYVCMHIGLGWDVCGEF